MREGREALPFSKKKRLLSHRRLAIFVGMNAVQSSTRADAARFIKLVGDARWRRRIAEITDLAGGGNHVGRAARQHYFTELAIDRIARGGDRQISPVETRILDLAMEAARLSAALSPDGRAGLRASLGAALTDNNTLVSLFHLLRTAATQRARGFDVRFAGFADGAVFDLLISRDGVAAEVACDMISAEEGRDVRRGAWADLVDRIDPDLQTWLESHPGRYVLKLTLPHGLREDAGSLAALHGRIRDMLGGGARNDQDAAAVLRLDPLMLAAAQASETGLLAGMRQEFGAEAHLAVTTAGAGVFVLAARAGRENEIAAAVRRRLVALSPTRLSGQRPGILAMFIEDTDRAEWRELNDRLVLEGEVRQFLAHHTARGVVAVSCTSRHEWLSGVADGERRFRNTANPAAKAAALAPAVMSTM